MICHVNDKSKRRTRTRTQKNVILLKDIVGKCMEYQ